MKTLAIHGINERIKCYKKYKNDEAKYEAQGIRIGLFLSLEINMKQNSYIVDCIHAKRKIDINQLRLLEK